MYNIINLFFSSFQKNLSCNIKFIVDALFSCSSYEPNEFAILSKYWYKILKKNEFMLSNKMEEIMSKLLFNMKK